MSKKKGMGWHDEIERHVEAGRKGGQKTALNKEHLRKVGAIGGKISRKGSKWSPTPQKASNEKETGQNEGQETLQEGDVNQG